MKENTVLCISIWYVLCCRLHGVIKHDDDDDKTNVFRYHSVSLNATTVNYAKIIN